MRAEESVVSFPATRMRGNPLSLGASLCTASRYVAAARAFWPHKTAEHWAAAAGVQPRMAKYWLAGTHDVSAEGQLAIRRELDQ